VADAAEQIHSLMDGGLGADVGSPVKKIRKFRLTPRPSAVLRHLKALLDNAQLTPELEKAVEAEAQSSVQWLDTAALYKTVSPSDLSGWGESLPGALVSESRQISFTLLSATLGLPLEAQLGDALARGENLRARLLTALGEELADQAAHFVERLVSEEAHQESSETEDRLDLSKSPALSTVLNRLDAGRIGVRVDDQGRLAPRFTRVAVIPWGRPSKKKK
jgi:hypothetical protein